MGITLEPDILFDLDELIQQHIDLDHLQHPFTRRRLIK